MVELDKPDEDPKISGDPLRTLFLARLAYDVTEKDLEQEFSRYGPIEKVLHTPPKHQSHQPQQC